MPKTMPRRLVALSASAVATIYAAGLLSTRAAAQSEAVTAAVDTPVVPTSTASLAATATTQPTSVLAVVGASATATPTTAATASPTASTSSYADGTYTGTGTSRFGNVTVSVTTSGGVISNVQITRVTTSYPVSRIASLPAQVVQNQTASVNVVSGATYSSQAFKQAVQQALSQALAA
jgi:uncharacterized protein with FMN-binding domain